MKSLFVKLVRSGSSLSAAVLALAIGSLGFLVSDGAGAQSGIEEIVVTARKRTENLQDVPLSITAVSSETLQQASVYGLEDLAEITPGLTFQKIGSISTPTIRGLAQTDQGGLQGNVGVFLDGVFLNNRSSLEFGVLDLERIEVVKGPQGALYGRDTFAGAINYVSKAPSTEGFEGKVTAEVGSNGRFEVGGSINVPLGETAAARLFASNAEFDGTIDNLRGGNELGGYDQRRAYGLSLLVEPMENMRVRFFTMKNELEEDQPPLVLIPSSVNNCGTLYPTPASGNLWSLFCGDLGSATNPNLDDRGFGQDGDIQLSYLDIEYDFPVATLSVNYSDSDSTYFTFIDNVSDPTAVTRPFFPGSPFAAQFFTNSGGDTAEHNSFEVRLTSNDDGPLSWIFGGSWFDTQTGSIINSFSPLVADPDTIERITRVSQRLDTDILAVFGSIGYQINERHKVSAELRYTEEDQFLVSETIIDFIPAFPSSTVSRGVDFDYTTPRLTYEYSWSDDVLLYASAAKGVKTGGVNRTIQDPRFLTFDPEENWTYEVGAKTTILGGRGTLNATAYYVDWTDLQNRAPASLATGSFIINADEATSIGLEVDSTINVTENFELRGAFTILNPEYGDDVFDASISSLCGETTAIVPIESCSTNVSGNQLARTSDLQVYLGGTYTWPQLIGDFDAYVRADVSHQAGKYSLSLNLVDQGDINLTNLRFGLISDRYEFSLWAENLFDESYVSRATVQTDPGLTFACPGCGITRLTVYPGNGRAFGLRANARF